MTAMRHLPLAFSCDRQWSEMTGDATVRSCHDCGCQVLNLSSLDEESASTLLAEGRARVCVRYRSRRGKVLFSKTRNALAVAAAALLIASSAAADTSVPPPQPGKRAKVEAPKKRAAMKKKNPRHDDDDVGLVILSPTF
jgi:hypothetical protein